MLSQKFPSNNDTAITQTSILNYYRGPARNTQVRIYETVYGVLLSQMQTIDNVKGNIRNLN